MNIFNLLQHFFYFSKREFKTSKYLTKYYTNLKCIILKYLKLIDLILTDIDESSGGTFAELLTFIGKRDFHDSWDVAGRGLYSDGVRCNELENGNFH